MKIIAIKKPAEGGAFLTVGKEYDVLAIESDWYRVLDDSSEPYLFDPASFNVTDPEEPFFWVSETGEDGERYAGPQEWKEAGFFEDYFDGNDKVRNLFWTSFNRLFAKNESEPGKSSLRGVPRR